MQWILFRELELMNRYTYILLLYSVVALVLITPSFGKANQHNAIQSNLKTIRIGVLARRGSDECLESWGPTADYLSRRIRGCRFEIVPMGFEQVDQIVQSGDVDFVIVNSSFYVELKARFGVTCVATEKDCAANAHSAVFGGVIFTRADRTDINALGDLKDRSFAGADRSSFGGWIAAWREFNAIGIDPFRDFGKLVFPGTQDGVVYAVRDGRVDAGTVATQILEKMAKEGKIQLQDFKIINSHEDSDFPYAHSTRLYPNWPFAKLKNTPGDLAESVAIALFSMAHDSPAVMAMGGGDWTTPLDYGPIVECLQELHIGIYKNFGKITAADIFRNYKWDIILVPLAMGCVAGLLVLTLCLNYNLRKSHSSLQSEIRERENAEAALKRECRQKELILLTAGEGIVGIDPGGKIMFVNPAATLVSGWNDSELLGRSFHYLFHHTKPDGSPHGTDDCPILKSIAEGKACGGEYLFWRKNGSAFFAECTSTPIIEEGKGCGGVLTFRDITERKDAEEKLVLSENRYRRLFEDAVLGIFRYTPEGRIVDVNPAYARMFGFNSPEEAKAQIKNITELYVNPRRRGKIIDRVLSSKGSFHTENWYKRKDGTVFYGNLHAWAVFDGEGSPLYIEGFVEDISERKRSEQERAALEAQLQQAQKLEAIGILAGGIAHDFNNILTPIIGYAELGLALNLPANPIRTGMEQTLKAALRAKELVKQIVAFGRPQNEQKRMLVEIGCIVKEALKLLRASIPSSVEIRQNIASSSAMADPTQIHQMVVNLCINAAHAMDGKGVLEVSLSHTELSEADLANGPIVDVGPGRYLKLCVSDTGCGIDPSALPRIFDPYFTTKEVGKGSGLGLSVAHGIVKRHGGAIQVRSEVGKGSTFAVYIPSAEATVSEDADSLQELPGGLDSILLVDDDQTIVEVLTEVLTLLGYEVTAETDSLRALEIFRFNSDRFDLVITDCTMPKLNGVELSSKIRLIRPDVPIMLCTGSSGKVIEQQAMDLGVQLVMKPLDMRQIAETVRNILSEARTSQGDCMTCGM